MSTNALCIMDGKKITYINLCCFSTIVGYDYVRPRLINELVPGLSNQLIFSKPREESLVSIQLFNLVLEVLLVCPMVLALLPCSRILKPIKETKQCSEACPANFGVCRIRIMDYRSCSFNHGCTLPQSLWRDKLQ